MAQPKQEEAKLFTCQNDSCKKTFAKPLQALDFQTKSGEIYEACPYCLSKVSSTVEKTVVPAVITCASSQAKPSCPHHLGYLSERNGKDQIPDGCIVCKDIVSCMLKDMNK